MSAKPLIHIVITWVVFITACDSFLKHPEEEPVARVMDKYLYPSELKELIGPAISPSDSAQIVKNYIDEWIRKQLLLNKAELNLTEEQKDVSKQLEEYRSSLLIYKYEKNLIQQKLDTNISEAAIQNYYEENKSNFILEEPIVRALYIKVPLEAPNLNRLIYLYRSDSEDDIYQLESYCYQYAQKYDDFNDEWIEFNDILNEVPLNTSDPERFLRYNNYINVRDSSYLYLVRFREKIMPREEAPLNYVRSKIKSILMTKRKVEFINNLEANIYNNARNKGHFTIYY